MQKEISISQLYKTYHGDLLRYAFSLLKNIEDSHDAVQDVFIKHVTFNKFNGNCSHKTWFFTLIRNHCYNVLKSSGKKLFSSEEYINANFTPNYDLKITLEEALATLSEEDNELIFLKDYARYSIKEISDLLNLSESNVKIKLFRAKNKLRKLLKDK